MKTVNETLSAQRDYLIKWGRPHEADHSLNDTNRDLIQALAAAHCGSAYLGAINGHGLFRPILPGERSDPASRHSDGASL